MAPYPTQLMLPVTKAPQNRLFSLQTHTRTHRSSYPSDGVLAFLAYGGHALLVAWFTVRLISFHHKGLVAQLLNAFSACEVLRVPEPA